MNTYQANKLINLKGVKMANLVENELNQLVHENAEVFTIEGYKAVIYISHENKCIRGYRGKSKKPFINNGGFSTVEMFNRMVEHYKNSLKREAEEELKMKALSKKVKAETKVGDVFSSSWGCEQTNVTYYQVVEIKGASFSLREIRGERIEDSKGCMYGKVVPMIGEFVNDKVIVKRVSNRGGFNITDYEHASPLEYTINEITGSRIYKAERYSSYA